MRPEITYLHGAAILAVLFGPAILCWTLGLVNAIIEKWEDR